METEQSHDRERKVSFSYDLTAGWKYMMTMMIMIIIIIIKG